MHRLIVLFIVLFFAVPLSARPIGESSRFKVEICPLFDDFRIKDHVASPLIFRGRGIVPDVSFYYGNPSLFHQLNVGYKTTRLHSTSNLTAKNYSGHLDYRVQKKYFELKDSRVLLFFGFAWKNLASITDHSVVFANGTWLISSTINLDSSIELKLNDSNTLGLLLQIPIIGYNVRPYYVIYDYREGESISNLVHRYLADGDFSLPGDFFSYSHNISYKYSLNNEMEFSVVYGFSFFFHEKPRQLRLIKNTFGFKFAVFQM